MSRDPKQTLSSDEIANEVPRGWAEAGDGIKARFGTGSFMQGLELVKGIAEAAEAANHHPDVTLTYPTVDVLLTSHDVSGVTQRDIDLAEQISGFAENQGADPA